MHVLLTGATGFIGSHTASALIAKGHSVRFLVRNPEKLAKILARHSLSAGDIVRGDITDSAIVRESLKGCDAVVHAAAFVSTNSADQERVYTTNVEGTKAVIGQAAELGLKHIVHVSSASALYDPELNVLTGDEPVSPSQSSYGRSKADAETYVRALQDQGFPVATTYPASVIGPCNPALSEPHRALKIFLTRMGILTSSGLQNVDVRDVAETHVAMIEKLSGPARITVGGHYLPWRDLIAELEQLTGRRLLKAPIPGAVLRAAGVGGDAFMRLSGRFTTINSESMLYGTRWVPTDDHRRRELLGLAYRDTRETLQDALLSMYQDGHLKRRHIGMLG